eukprot:320172-Ditylum_brightwellii.AAC.1
MESVSQALENLANAAIADQDTTAILITANNELTESNKLLAEQVKKLTDKYTELHDMIKTNQNGNTQPTRASRTQRVEYDPHGVTCPNKQEGHQEAATRSNTLGGSNKGKNWRFD